MPKKTKSSYATPTEAKAKKKKKSRMKRRMPLVGIFLLLVGGVGLFMYPIISNWLTEYTAHSAIDSYNDAMQKIDDDTINKLEQQAAEYNKSLKSQNVKTSTVSYDDLLAVSDAMAYVEIPKIGVYLPVYHNMTDEILQKGIGHMKGTSLPLGGESTHSVLAGHTGLPSAKLFTDIDQLVEGDAFYIHVLNKVLKYEVDHIVVVLPSDAKDIAIEEGKDYVTLLTCTPYGLNTHRLLVRGARKPYDISTMSNGSGYMSFDSSEEKIPVRTIVWYTAAIVVGIITFVIMMILLFPNMQTVKRNIETRKARKAEKAFEALIAEEARQIEEAKRAAAEGWADREDSL